MCFSDMVSWLLQIASRGNDTKKWCFTRIGNVEVVGWVASGSDTRMKSSGRRFMFGSLS